MSGQTEIWYSCLFTFELIFPIHPPQFVRYLHIHLVLPSHPPILTSFPPFVHSLDHAHYTSTFLMFRATPLLQVQARHILEVERKFAPTPLSISLLTRNAGLPAFSRHATQPSLVFEDTYYDRDDTLMKQGVYVRSRRYIDHLKPSAENWEAKIRISGDFTRSAFQELQGFDAVARLLRERFPNHHHQNHQHALKPTISMSEEGEARLGFDMLEVLARFVTHRRQWLINERFHVVIDEADFGHVVGEVELTQESARAEKEKEGVSEHEGLGVGEGTSGIRDEGKGDRDLAKDLDAEIEDFMGYYAWVFPRGEVKGKLSAYFEWRKRSERGR